METHTDGAEKRLPDAGDAVDLARPGGWAPGEVTRRTVLGSGQPGFYARPKGRRSGGLLYAVAECGSGWRWPEADAVRVQGEGFPCPNKGAEHPPLKGVGFGSGRWTCEPCGGWWHEDDLTKLVPFGTGEVPSGAAPGRCGATLDRPIGWVQCGLSEGHAGNHYRAIDDGSGDVSWPREGEVPSPLALQMCRGGCGTPANAGSVTCGRALCLEAAAAMPEGEVSGYTCMGCLHPRPGFFIKPGAHGVGPGGEPCVNAGKRVPPEPLFRLDDLPPGEVTERLVNQGGAGRVEWRLSSRAGVYTGRVLIAGAVAATFTGADSESVMQSMLAKVDSMLDPRDTRAPYEPPTVTRLDQLREEVAARLGLHVVQNGLARRVDDLSHGLHRMRGVVVDVVVDWYERQRAEWASAPALRDLKPADREVCRQLHERQLTQLFAKIGGVL